MEKSLSSLTSNLLSQCEDTLKNSDFLIEKGKIFLSLWEIEENISKLQGKTISSQHLIELHDFISKRNDIINSFEKYK